MKKIIIICALVLTSVALLSCEENYDDKLKRFVAGVSGNRLGGSSDYWIMKHNAFGQWEKVALVFGFMDDLKFCDDVIQLYMRWNPPERYMCMPAN